MHVFTHIPHAWKAPLSLKFIPLTWVDVMGVGVGYDRVRAAKPRAHIELGEIEAMANIGLAVSR